MIYRQALFRLSNFFPYSCVCVYVCGGKSSNFFIFFFIICPPTDDDQNENKNINDFSHLMDCFTDIFKWYKWCLVGISSLLRDSTFYAFSQFLLKTWTWSWPSESFNLLPRTCSCDCLFDSESMGCTWQHSHIRRVALAVRTLFPSSPFIYIVNMYMY